jgi:hypothetical protein
MIPLAMPSNLFSILRSGFELSAADPDAPVELEVLDAVRLALDKAVTTALPGLPVVVMLDNTDELAALASCFEVASDGAEDVTDDQWGSILALLAQASRHPAAT